MLTSDPKRAGIKEYKLKMTATLFKVVKMLKQTKWQEMSQSMVTDVYPEYDGGTLISEGSVTIVQQAGAAQQQVVVVAGET